MAWIAKTLSKQIVGDNLLVQVQFDNGQGWTLVKHYSPFSHLNLEEWIKDEIRQAEEALLKFNAVDDTKEAHVDENGDVTYVAVQAEPVIEEPIEG